MLIAAISVATGQFCWKIAAGDFNGWLVAGFMIYGLGGVVMVSAFKFGEVSALHPLMAASYVVALCLGIFVLRESVSLKQMLGVLCVMSGIFLVSRS